jgi:ABC-type lipoprotein release transport system permease subunit
MERTLLVIIVACIFGAGLLAGVLGIQQLTNPVSVQDDYTTIKGECQIRVYDDPLYAEHWAKNVNPQNCQSYKVQEQANQIKAVTRDIEWSTTNGMIGVYSILGVVAVGLFVIFVLIIKG